MGTMRIDLTGKRFGRLLVLERFKCDGRRVRWLCLCDCGTKRDILGQNLRNGRVTSCGCWNREKAAERMRNRKGAHRQKGTKLYSVWCGMRERCLRAKGRNFEQYQGRKISICKEWDDFKAFKAWADSSGYKHGLQIDRIDNNGNYCPENCRFVTPADNVRNRRNTIRVTIKGVTRPLAEWCEKLGVLYETGKSRYYRGIPLDAPYKPKQYDKAKTSGPH